MHPGGTPPAQPLLEPQSYEMLGVRFNLVDRPELLDEIERAVEAGERRVVGGHNLHSVYLYHRDARMRRFFAESRVTFVDGMPLVWVARMLGYPARRKHRNSPLDWMPSLLERASQRGWRVFFLGSSPEIEPKAARVFRARYPDLKLETHHGYFDTRPGSPGNDAVLARIRAFRPHVVGVCMGMPLQEQWIVDNFDELPPAAIFDLGALMDQLSGELPYAPRWVGQLGLEWFYRLCTQPGRVWRRYLVEPWFLLPHLARDLVRSRRAPAIRGE
jgi:N-acetylglucosaminyldiphosphoundecaprenol N-acetyl-beta-D-mannosaminyltransferase